MRFTSHCRMERLRSVHPLPSPPFWCALPSSRIISLRMQPSSMRRRLTAGCCPLLCGRPFVYVVACGVSHSLCAATRSFPSLFVLRRYGSFFGYSAVPFVSGGDLDAALDVSISCTPAAVPIASAGSTINCDVGSTVSAAFGDVAGKLIGQCALTLQRALFRIFGCVLNGQGPSLHPSLCRQLLTGEEVVVIGSKGSVPAIANRPASPLNPKGIVCSPLLVEMSLSLFNWAQGSPPTMQDFCNVGELKDVPQAHDVHERLWHCDPLVKELFQIIRRDESTASAPSSEGVGRAADFLLSIGDLGIVRGLLRGRITAGSLKAVSEHGVLPLSMHALFKSFLSPFCVGAQLSTGARALAKHIHRDESSAWWGGGAERELKGSEAEKNAAAMNVLRRILSEAVWMNCHVLPHDVFVFEVRVREGYGARWAMVGNRASFGNEVQFRGFLEPQDPHGHENGWRH